MKKRKEGNVYEINLMPFYNGFAYAKYIQVPNYIPDSFYRDMFIVSDRVFDQPIMEFSDDFFETLLLNPTYVTGGNAIARDLNCITNIPVKQTELIFPPIRDLHYQREQENGLEFEKWDIIGTDHRRINLKPYSFNEVKHLTSLSGCVNVCFFDYFIALKYCQSKGFDWPNPPDSNWIYKHIFKYESMTTPLNQVPIEKRFKIEPR